MSKVVSSFFKFIKLGISSFELCFPFIIDFIEYKEQYLNSRFRSETRFQSCLKKHYLFFAPQKLKKTPFKSCSENLKIPFYFLTALSCPNSPKRRIHVSKCGLQTNCIQNWVYYYPTQFKGSSCALLQMNQRLHNNFETR